MGALFISFDDVLFPWLIIILWFGHLRKQASFTVFTDWLRQENPFKSQRILGGWLVPSVRRLITGVFGQAVLNLVSRWAGLVIWSMGSSLGYGSTEAGLRPGYSGGLLALESLMMGLGLGSRYVGLDPGSSGINKVQGYTKGGAGVYLNNFRYYCTCTLPSPLFQGVLFFHN